jgi:hypothetical protein
MPSKTLLIIFDYEILDSFYENIDFAIWGQFFTDELCLGYKNIEI